MLGADGMLAALHLPLPIQKVAIKIVFIGRVVVGLFKETRVRPVI